VCSETKNETSKYTVDDLTELVGAVRFAHPDASMRKVHREISEKMSQQESFEFLKGVELKEVKKVWKRATASSSSNNNNNNNTPSASSTVRASLLEAAAKTSDDGVLKFYTIGDASVKTLATEYAAQAAAEAAKEHSASTTKQEAEAEDLGNYVHVFLDVPADRSGARPHQAIINFNTTNNADGAAKSTNRAERRQQARNSKGKAPSSAASDNNEKGEALVKIQVAASNADEDASMKHPMLLYNQDRTARTFIHPPSTDDDETYDKIHALIVTQGIGGALGMIGGTKGYMYSRITKRDSGQQDIISINISKGLAPTPNPPW
jgi:hypothetical protein